MLKIWNRYKGKLEDVKYRLLKPEIRVKMIINGSWPNQKWYTVHYCNGTYYHGNAWEYSDQGFSNLYISSDTYDLHSNFFVRIFSPGVQLVRHFKEGIL